MHRPPRCRTLEEMRALRVPTICAEGALRVPTICAEGALPVAYVTAACRPTRCQFFPYVCNHNNPEGVRDWCLFCTRRLLFPEDGACVAPPPYYYCPR